MVAFEPVPSDKMQTEIVTKALEGLDRYIQHLNDVMDGYLTLDSEIKQKNHFGTCLKGKEVKRVQELTEIAIRMSKDLEAKYGISIRKAEADEKSMSLIHSIDSQLAEFEADTERQQKAKSEESQFDAILKSTFSQVAVTGNKEAVL